MGLFEKEKSDEAALIEITPELKVKLDELAERGNQFEDQGKYEEALQVWKETLNQIPEPQQFYSEKGLKKRRIYVIGLQQP